MEIMFDRRGFIEPSFRDCPSCGKKAVFGVSGINDNHYIRTCRVCGESQLLDLPPVKKRIIYIDQFVLSGMLKELDNGSSPSSRKNANPFYLDLFGQLDRLGKLMLIVCPYSPVHMSESKAIEQVAESGADERPRIENTRQFGERFEQLRLLLGHLAYETKFIRYETVRERQVLAALEAWLKGCTAFPADLAPSDSISGKIDIWLPTLYPAVGSPADRDEVEAILAGQATFGGDALRLMSVSETDDLVREGRSLIVVALVGANLHIRIFDPSGKNVIDKPEVDLVSGQERTDLKEFLISNPFPDDSKLSPEKKQEIIKKAASIAGHTRLGNGLDTVVSRWRREKHKKFKDWFAEEVAGHADTLLHAYRRHEPQLNALRKRLDLDRLPCPQDPAAALMLSILQRLEGGGCKREECEARAREFLTSGIFSSIPIVRIGAALWAGFADRLVHGGKKEAETSFGNDAKFLSAYLPYCDAMFIDRPCAEMLKKQPVSHKVPESARVYSMQSKDEFLLFLKGIESAAPPEHLAKVIEVYGDDWLKPSNDLLKPF